MISGFAGHIIVIIDITEISIVALDAYRSFIHAFVLSLYSHWSVVYVHISCLVV